MGCFPSKRSKDQRLGKTSKLEPQVDPNQHKHQTPSKQELKNHMKMNPNHESRPMTATDDGIRHTNETAPHMQAVPTNASSPTTTTTAAAVIPSEVSTLSNTSAKTEIQMNVFKDSLLNNNPTDSEMNADLNAMLTVGGAHQSLICSNGPTLECESNKKIETMAKMGNNYKRKKQSPYVRVMCSELNDCLKTEGNVFKIVSFAKQETIAVKQLDVIENGLNAYKDVTSVHFNDIEELIIHSGNYCKEVRLSLKSDSILTISEDIVKSNLSMSAYPRVLSFIALTESEATNAFNTETNNRLTYAEIILPNDNHMDWENHKSILGMNDINDYRHRSQSPHVLLGAKGNRTVGTLSRRSDQTLDEDSISVVTTTNTPIMSMNAKNDNTTVESIHWVIMDNDGTDFPTLV
ncbi:unnamed protein product [Medioppia subpectinata]|uniref:Uncharacterized protein n=1 Tax=Medioppia subpectinata TaxID=1979941 RepID=A0A7R9KN77_9ACAR|nr:unnamed protein product [Medioppia subpectinata]CAG2106688.1 unnamed protein product [Medioppia subpectinata]